jgi:hypothetical protein
MFTSSSSGVEVYVSFNGRNALDLGVASTDVQENTTT